MNPSIQLDISLNVAGYLQNRVHIEVGCQSGQAENRFRLEALAIDQGLRVVDFQVTDDSNQPIDFEIAGTMIDIAAADFHITYDIESDYGDCVGADVDVELVYPFMNEEEIFLGSGIIAYPWLLQELETDIEARLWIENLPTDWKVLSSFVGEEISPATLDGFFWYAASELVVEEHIYQGREQFIKFGLGVQKEKRIPIRGQELWGFIDGCLDWMETHLAPYRQAEEIHILMLQAPENFQDIAQRPTFATGENVLNGIVTYGPDSSRYFERLFGYSDYKLFLLDGMAHELMHTYTTTAWQGKYKSVLVPTVGCPSNHARLIGEGLNQYFHRQILYGYLDGSTERFFTETLAHTLNRQRQWGQKEVLLDLLVFDAYLREQDCSLMALFGAMIQEKQRDRTAYESGEWMLDVLGETLGIQVSEAYRELLLGNDVPDYVGLMDTALGQFGYELKEQDGEFNITPSGRAQSTFDLT